MTVLLASDEVVLLAPPSGTDAYGQALAPADEAWAGYGNLQEAVEPGGVGHAEEGGRGRYGPAEGAGGRLFLPTDAPAFPGVVAVVRGRRWVVVGVAEVADPTGGRLSCVEALVRAEE